MQFDSVKSMIIHNPLTNGANGKRGMGGKPVTGGGKRGAADEIDDEIAAGLRALGESIRGARLQRGMTRRILARDSGVSERYLAQLEGGDGNPSIAIVWQIARAMGLGMADLVPDMKTRSGEWKAAAGLLERLGAADLARARALLADQFSDGGDHAAKARRVALVGLRGAGKSTLGRGLAEALDCPFVELNRIIEREYGASVGEILALSGQPAFRRHERRCLEMIVGQYDRVVIEAGGGIVSERATYDVLLGAAHTVWLRAAPVDHMNRVIEQGDLRPMAQNTEAMEDLEAILSVREPLYREADARLETSARTIPECLDLLIVQVRRLLGE